MGNLICGLPDRSNLRLSERPVNHTVFVNAFQYCRYNNMSARKSQMFFDGGENFFEARWKTQNSIDKSSLLCFNVYNSYWKDVDGKLVPIGMFQRAGGWCKPVHSIRTIWFLSWPCKHPMRLVMRHGCPVIGWDSVRSPRVISLFER